MRFTKIFGAAGALIAAALVGGTLIGSALATDDATDTDATADGAAAYCDVFMETLAAELGTTREALLAAGQSAANAAIDAALEAGDLDEDRAEALRERVADADAGCGWLAHGFGRGFGHGFARGFGHGFLGAGVLEAAADALGLDSADVIGQLRDAGSLRALAEAQGASYEEVSASVLAAVQADLDAAVAEGLSQDRADAALERIATWLDAGGELERIGPGGGRFGPGGPWHRHHGDDAEGSEG